MFRYDFQDYSLEVDPRHNMHERWEASTHRAVQLLLRLRVLARESSVMLVLQGLLLHLVVNRRHATIDQMRIGHRLVAAIVKLNAHIAAVLCDVPAKFSAALLAANVTSFPARMQSAIE